MAEARSGTQQPSLTLQVGLAVTPFVDFARATRRSIIRNSYRFWNRVRDNLWPLSAWYLSMLLLSLTAMVIEENHCPKQLLAAFHYLQHLLQLDNQDLDVIHFARFTQVLICAAVSCVCIVLSLALVRQMGLKCLLSWKGWLHQGPAGKKKGWSLLLWGFSVRLLSGPTPSLFSFQRCLPRLPVPPLCGTISKFLDTMHPVLSQQEFEDLQVQAHAFERGAGVHMQRILMLKSWWASNYVSDWWEQYVYLMGRSSIAMNSNYCALDQYAYLPTKNRAARAAGLIWLIGSFYDAVMRENLQPLQIQGLIPLCMEQYRRVLGVTRIPGRELDELKCVDKAKHVVVFYKGGYFRLDLHDKGRCRLSPRELEHQIEQIVSNVDESEGDVRSAESRLAALTGAERQVWYEMRQAMLESDVTRKSLNQVETAMFFVSLSDDTPNTLSERSQAAFHGDGSNIWYDKSVSLTVYANGRCSLNIEHSWGDAPVVGHMLEYSFPAEYELAVYKLDGHCAERTENDRIPWHKRVESLHKPTRLSWKLTPVVQQAVLDTYHTLEKFREDSIFSSFVFDEYGKKYITRVAKCSPDSFIQMVLQAAYFRDTAGKFVLTYEAAMTRLFRNGRTETIRTVTDESCKAIRAMTSKQLSAKEKHRLLCEACTLHQTNSRAAMCGYGADRHLFALYVVCKGLGKENDFLKRALSFPWTLSTSQQPIAQTPHCLPMADDPVFQNQIPLGGAFMAVADDGYGVSYNVVGSQRLQFHISSTKQHLKKTDANRFAGHVLAVLRDWKGVVDEATAS